MADAAPARIRAWARANGYVVADRGRLPADVVAAYRTAHAGRATGPLHPETAPPVPDGGSGSTAASAPPRQEQASRTWTPFVASDAPPPGTNGWSVTALVLGLLGGGPLAVIAGVLGIRSTRESGQAGRGLAVAGVVLGALSSVFFLVVLLSDTPVERSPEGVLVSAGDLPLGDLRSGDCLSDLPLDEPDDPIAVQPCAGVHAAQVFSGYTAVGGPYPGREELTAGARTTCRERLLQADFTADQSTYEVLTIVPDRDRWEAGDRRVLCLITSASSGELTDSDLVTVP